MQEQTNEHSTAQYHIQELRSTHPYMVLTFMQETSIFQ